jgi:hypothetical protein
MKKKINQKMTFSTDSLATSHTGVRGLFMDTLKFESNPVKQTALSLACIVAGITLVHCFINSVTYFSAMRLMEKMPL